MVVLRCTQKLLVRLKQIDGLPPVESTTRLGDWYGNVLRIGRRQHLLFISERSRLPVVIPIRETKHLEAVFLEAVCDVLAAVGIGAKHIVEERSRMSDIAFGRTNNRSLLGTLNDFAFHDGPSTGAPILDQAVAFIECEVRNTVDVGGHDLFIGEVVNAAFQKDEELPVLRMEDTRMNYGG